MEAQAFAAYDDVIEVPTVYVPAMLGPEPRE